MNVCAQGIQTPLTENAQSLGMGIYLSGTCKDSGLLPAVSYFKVRETNQLIGASALAFQLHTISPFRFSAIATVYLEEGNKEYRRKEASNAVSFYTQGIQVSCKDDVLNAKLYSNRATAHFNLGEIY